MILENKKKMLWNAGEIQNLKNYLSDENNTYFINENREIVVELYNDLGKCMEVTFDKKVSSFILKKRTLRSGLKSPMARWLAWQTINKIEDKEADKDIWLTQLLDDVDNWEEEEIEDFDLEY